MPMEPTRIAIADYTTCKVLAGPLGFYGRAYGVVMGACRPTIAEAERDMTIAADWIEQGGFAAAAHAWREVN